MSSERPSRNNRVEKVARSFKGKLSSLLHLERPPTPSSIAVGLGSGSHLATVDAGTSNLALEMVPVVGVDRPLATAVGSTEAYTVSSLISAPIPASGPVVPWQPDSASSQGPETPPMHTSPNNPSPMTLFHGAHNVYLYQSTIEMTNSHTSPNSPSPMTLFQGAQNVYLHQSTIEMANSIQHVSKADENGQLRSRILVSVYNL
ncbi:hypothetical protein BYT27DRAFT_6406090 [Phlegmacium glaucopus]|nr:hypothetical protein BYT27DRAFT_6406090 [Phlegmacium glaucopus]